jgi:hypothetical protein
MSKRGYSIPVPFRRPRIALQVDRGGAFAGPCVDNGRARPDVKVATDWASEQRIGRNVTIHSRGIRAIPSVSETGITDKSLNLKIGGGESGVNLPQ